MLLTPCLCVAIQAWAYFNSYSSTLIIIKHHWLLAPYPWSFNKLFPWSFILKYDAFKRLSKCPEQTKQEKISKSIWNSIKSSLYMGNLQKRKSEISAMSSDTIQQPMQILDFYELSPSIKKQHTPLYIPLSVNGRTTLCPFAPVQYVQTLPLLVLNDWQIDAL